jgi:hypothetical protein
MVTQAKTMSLEQAKSLYLQVAQFGGVDREMIGSHPIAERASQMPWMTEDEFRELQISIHEHGLIEKVELNASDEVCDGRNRLLACFAQDVDPEFKYSEMDNDKDLVDVRNLRRRHLEPGVRAMLYLKMNGHIAGLDSDDAAEVQADETSGSSPIVSGVSNELAADNTEPKASSEPAATATVAGTAETKKPDKGGSKKKSGKAEKKKTLEQQAKEAGVSDRTMRSAHNVNDSGVDELKDAAINGDISLRDAEQISTLPPEQQRQELSSRESTGRKRRQVSESEFNLDKTVESFGRRISKMLAGVPQSMRDTVHRRLGESFGSTVRLEKETSDLMNSEGVVPYVEQLIAEMPKTERAGAEKALAERYGNVVVAKDADTVLPKIAGLIEGLSEREKKKVATALGEQFKSTPTKPADYLPKLPDDHAAACEVLQKEIKVRVEQLMGFEDWEVNGRRDSGRALKKSALGQFRKFAQHAKLETEEQPSLIDVKYPEHLDNDDFKTAWTEWLGAKTRQKKAVTVQTQARQLNILAHFDTKQAVEILTKAMQKPWDGIPVYRELASTSWDGRPPAFPPADAAPADAAPATQGQSAPAKPRIPNVPTRPAMTDRSRHGRLDTSRVPTVEENDASADA